MASPRIPIVFFGSGPVAAQSLKLLLSNFEVVAVVTKPKPAHHRGSFPVIDLANDEKLPLHTVKNKKELSELIATEPFNVEVAILIDFGIIVSQDVIDYFPKGIINSHFSLLPQWRGADPITFALLSGQARTGVSLMLLVEAMDEGPIIAVGLQDLDGTETTPELTKQLINLSDTLLKEQVARYLSNGKTISQSDIPSQIPDYPNTPTYSRKLTKQDGILDFTKSAPELEREIRAFLEWPKSRTKLADIDVIITSAIATDDRGNPGEYQINNAELLLFCVKGALSVREIKPAGKQAMPIGAFLAGYASRL